jgi:hypothetical protein
MSDFVFITVLATMVAGGLYARSLMELSWPKGLPRLHSED